MRKPTAPRRIARFDARLLDGLHSEHHALALLQTVPGVELIGAARLLVEIGTDMDAFGSADPLAVPNQCSRRSSRLSCSGVLTNAPSIKRNAPRWIKALIKHGFLNPASA